MIINFIYNTPTWVWGTAFVLLLDAAACTGLVVFHRVVHVDLRRAHNELTGFTVAVISVTYAVLLAFIAIATWESFTNSEGIVDREADYVGSIYRDTQGLPPEMGQGIRDDIADYVNTVIHVEWPIQQRGKIPGQGWEPLRRVHSAIVTMQPSSRAKPSSRQSCSARSTCFMRARKSAGSSAGTYSGSNLVGYLFRRHDNYRLHLSVRFP
jgi:hypothetical protein